MSTKATLPKLQRKQWPGPQGINPKHSLFRLSGTCGLIQLPEMPQPHPRTTHSQGPHVTVFINYQLHFSPQDCKQDGELESDQRGKGGCVRKEEKKRKHKGKERGTMNENAVRQKERTNMGEQEVEVTFFL